VTSVSSTFITVESNELTRTASEFVRGCVFLVESAE